MADPRLRSIYFHAGRLFNKKRYANTKVAEIAAASGVATGTIYNLFASKKAILTFVIRASLDNGYLDQDIELPVEETDPKLLLELFSRFEDRVFNQVLRITDADGKITRSFPQMLSDMFDVDADALLGMNNIEHNADILRELAPVYFTMREELFRVMEENLVIYMGAGEIRQVEYPRIHVQSITDILTWWAMNAYVAMPEKAVPRETARKIAVDLVLRAYLTNYK